MKLKNPIKATVIAGLAIQLGRPLISLLTLPLLLSYLGQEGLGVWMISLSLMGMIGVFSTGLFTSVITAVGRASAENSTESIGRISSAATLISIALATVVAIVSVPLALLVDWEWLLGLDPRLSGEDIRMLMVALSIILSCNVIAYIPRQIMFGRNHGYLAHILEFTGLLAGAAGLVVGIYTNASLWVLASAFIGPSTLAVFLGGLAYLHRHGLVLFSQRFLDLTTLRSLARDSLNMLGYQGAIAVSSQSDLLLIGVVVGSQESAVYGIAQRVFSLPVLISMTVNNAQWPSLAQADAAGNREIVRSVLRRTLALGIGLATVVALLIAGTYNSLISLWLGQTIETHELILTGMVAWVIVATVVNTFDSVLRARNDTGFLMNCMIAMAIINLSTSLILLHWIGPAGAIWGTATGFTLALLLPFSIRLRNYLFLQKSDARRIPPCDEAKQQ